MVDPHRARQVSGTSDPPRAHGPGRSGPRRETAEPETDSLEWKGEWDLENAEQAFETARHILGFGNRAVATASAAFEGCAYLIVGIEPQTVFRTPVVDPAKIENKLGRYIEAGRPRWEPHYIEVDGKDVLVISIEPPRDGDPICTLQKGYNAIREGRIFIRRHGQTEEAKPSEIRALEVRIRQRVPNLRLTVERTADGALQPISIDKADKKAWLELERQRLALPPERPPARRDLFDFGTAQHHRIDHIINGDPRSRDEYSAEVATYLEVAESRYGLLLIEKVVEEGLAPIALRLLNPGDHNYEGVETVIEIPTNFAWLDADEPRSDLKRLKPPKPWGDKRRFDFDVPVVDPIDFASSDTISRTEEASTVCFGSRHVRPRAEIDLPPIFLGLRKRIGELTVRWRLTSTGVNGLQEGEVNFPVSEEPAKIAVVTGNPSSVSSST